MKLVSEPRVRSYELTYLIPATLTSDAVNAVTTAVAALIKKHGLTITNQEEWGKKELAYPIRYKGANEREAFYMHVVFEAAAEKVAAFEKDIYLNQDIIRHLLVLAEESGTAVTDLQESKEE